MSTTAFRTSTDAIHPTPNDDIVARVGVATSHAAIATTALLDASVRRPLTPLIAGAVHGLVHRRDDPIRSAQTEASETLHDFFTGSRSILTPPL